MIGLPGRDGLVNKVIDWRHYVAALKYLHLQKDQRSNATDLQRLDAKLAEYQELEHSKTQELWRMFKDWDKLLNGVPSEGHQPANELHGYYVQDIESRFEVWLAEKNGRVDEGYAKLEEQKTLQTPAASQSIAPASPSYPAYRPIPIEDRLAFDFVPKKENISTKEMRTDSGKLKPDASSFKVQSGVLLWGQLHTIFAGHIGREFQGNADTLNKHLSGGTIKQRVLKYRSAARVGEWKIRKAFSIPYPGNEGEPTKHFGWIFYHEDVRPLEVLDRCSRIVPGSSAISNDNDHIDRVSWFGMLQ